MKIGSAPAKNPASVELTGKDTALLTFANAETQSTDAKLTVKNVKTATGVSFDTVEKDVRFIDVVAPMTGSIEVIAPRVIRVHFSEPLASKPEFKLNNGQTAIVLADFTPGNDYADLTIGIDPANGSSHTLEVVGGADYAGFKIDAATKTFVYQTDVMAPSAMISKVLDNNSVEIKFSKEIDADSLTNNLKIYHTVKGGQGYEAADVTAIKPGTNDTIVVNFPNAVFPEGQVKFFLGYADEKGKLVQDKWGNKFAATELSAVYAADKEAPTLVSVEGKSKTTIELKLSEEVDADTVTKPGNIVLTDADNKVVAATAKLETDNKTVTLTTAELAGGNYKVVAKDIADASGNKLAEVARTFYVNDMVAPTVDGADLLAGGNKVKIKFSEAMNAASITDKSKYKVGAPSGALADLDSKVTVTAVDGNKAVILDFSAIKDANLAAYNVRVGRVADASGNFTANFFSDVTVAGTPTTISAETAEVTGLRTVKLYFGEVITNAVAKDFLVNDEAVTNVTNSIVSGKSVLTLTVSENLAYDAKNVTVTSAPTTEAKNNDGLLVELKNVEVKDKFAPEILTATFANGKDVDNKDLADELVINFSEALYAPSIQDSDFAVAGRTIESIDVDAAGTVTLKLKADGTITSAIPASVSIVNTIEDAARNAKTSQVFTGIKAQN